MALALGEQWPEGGHDRGRPETWFAPECSLTRATLEDFLDAAIEAQERWMAVRIARERRNPSPRIPPPDPQQRPGRVSPAAWAAVPEELRPDVTRFAGRFFLGGNHPDDAVALGIVAASRARSRTTAIAAAYPDATTAELEQVVNEVWTMPLSRAVREGVALLAERAEIAGRHLTPAALAEATALAERVADPPYPETYRHYAIAALAEALCDPSQRHVSPRSQVEHAREAGYHRMLRVLRESEPPEDDED